MGSVSGDTIGLFAAIGVRLPARRGNVDVRCFANPGGHTHKDTRKSCSVSTATGAWNCHGCGARGGAYDAAISVGIQPADAMRLLEQYGFVEANGRRPEAPQSTARPLPSEAQVAEWARALQDDEEQLSRLEQLRGWTRDPVRWLGLGTDGERVTIPVRAGDGSLVGLLRYQPDAAQRGAAAKTVALPGSRRDLFPSPEQLEPGSRTVFVLEGEPDAVRALSLGLEAVGLPGVQGWRPEWAARFRGFGLVVVCLDCDEQGRGAARRVAADADAAGVDVRILDLAPHRADGYDLTDYCADATTPELREQARALLLDLAAQTPPPTPEELDLAPSDETGETADATPFPGRSHADVLALELPAERYLIDDLVPIGAVGTIAGVPETHKSWLAQAIAVRVARGDGEILGRSVSRAAHVGYFWQDDSTREEAERVKVFERVHQTPDPASLPLRWFLNEGLELPIGLPRLRATVDVLALDLVILDSFYNLVPGLDLKDADAERTVALLKRDIADPTGCTVLIVDHMPWATDSNRGRLRAYGGVFKNAATRFGLYIDAQGTKLYLEARGNNIRGIKKTPAYWDADSLELRLVDTGDQTHDERVEQRAEAALTWLQDHPGQHSTTTVRKAVKGRDTVTDEALEALKARAEVQDLGRDGGPWSGRGGDARYWIASIHAPLGPPETTAQLFGPWSAEVPPGAHEDNPRPAPYRGPRFDGPRSYAGIPAAAAAGGSSPVEGPLGVATPGSPAVPAVDAPPYVARVRNPA